MVSINIWQSIQVENTDDESVKDDEKELVNLLELLEEDDDIQKIFHNCNLI